MIDATGDLCDRLLRILPPETYDRVIVIDTTAAWVPCINPFDRRLIRDKPRDVIAGEIGQIFARIEPEIWAGALINACYVAALVRRYPTDELSMAQQDRGRRQREPARSPAGPSVTPPSVPGPPGRQR